MMQLFADVYRAVYKLLLALTIGCSLYLGRQCSWYVDLQGSVSGVCRLSQAQFVTYNPELQIFSSSIISFDFTDGGSILVWMYVCVCMYVPLSVCLFVCLAIMALLQGLACSID